VSIAVITPALLSLGHTLRGSSTECRKWSILIVSEFVVLFFQFDLHVQLTHDASRLHDVELVTYTSVLCVDGCLLSLHVIHWNLEYNNIKDVDIATPRFVPTKVRFLHSWAAKLHSHVGSCLRGGLPQGFRIDRERSWIALSSSHV